MRGETNYRGYTIAPNEYRFSKQDSYHWYDPEHDPSPVEIYDGYDPGPNGYTATIEEAQTEIDHYIEHGEV